MIATASKIFVVAGIDGTGSKSWRRTDGANSHVFRFMKDVVNHGSGTGGTAGTDPAGYWHGPGNSGLNMGPIIVDVTTWILNQVEAQMKAHSVGQSDIQVAVVGHSRGASAAIAIANRLEKTGWGFFANRKSVTAPLQLSYVGLYDTVDRSLLTGQDTAMNNVAATRHARRMNRAWSGSRWSFGTVDSANTKDFDTAHGGIGGDPGYFTELGGMASDYYCNAVQLVMTQAELTKQYGQIVVRGMPLGPKYKPLTGSEYTNQLARVRKSITEVAAADKYIRDGAAAAGLQFKSPASAMMQFGSSEATLWARLMALK
ncbi:MAG: hypothetical protein IT162_12725 [Bryobacterales bacterium]|nr:hypothetical protein [Bryobacterales bacterium]